MDRRSEAKQKEAKLNYEVKKLELEKREQLRQRELDLEDRRLRLEERRMDMIEKNAWPPLPKPDIMQPMLGPSAQRVPWEEPL